MGSQGDMGTHHHAGLCAIDSLALAKEQITNHQQPITNHLPYPLYCRLPLRPVHLFWSELLLLRSAFVCLTDAKYNRMGKVRWFESSRRYGHDPENDTVYFYNAGEEVNFINDGPVTILLDTDEL